MFRLPVVVKNNVGIWKCVDNVWGTIVSESSFDRRLSYCLGNVSYQYYVIWLNFLNKIDLLVWLRFNLIIKWCWYFLDRNN